MFSFGKDFKITIFGASHDACIGVIVEGIQAGTKIDIDKIKLALDRRRPSLSTETARVESDEFSLISGLQNGMTTEAPLLIAIINEDVKKNDYDELIEKFRPGHADYSKFIKYSGNAFSTGGGIFSGRMTVAIVVAGEISRQINDFKVESDIVFADEGTGSNIKLIAKNINPGLGEPFFDSVESCISHLMFSIPSVKGIVFGNILNNYKKTSLEVVDEFYAEDKVIKTKHNYDGGIQGGITNGMPIELNVFLKPISSVMAEVNTVDKNFNNTKLRLKGRHDKQIANRVCVVLESVVQIALLDLYMRARWI